MTGADRKKVFVKSGEAVFWEQGEWHESGSDQGMAAMIVQSEHLTPKYLIQLQVSE
ncbi:hypothetical protein AT864_02508 [Anoxybacillus sp. P3H1B]|uniref:hypothetical protein n=1 Tax=Anoxybacillaceae TaxID=3120669 RepID=UPI0007991077|nr:MULTISPECIES: hypothetical protein [Anoxybacillus]KXG09278.1 hypothetical protein AT864_02508 [Anoxybacillus sp. P3H1B]